MAGIFDSVRESAKVVVNAPKKALDAAAIQGKKIPNVMAPTAQTLQQKKGTQTPIQVDLGPQDNAILKSFLQSAGAAQHIINQVGDSVYNVEKDLGKAVVKTGAKAAAMAFAPVQAASNTLTEVAKRGDAAGAAIKKGKPLNAGLETLIAAITGASLPLTAGVKVAEATGNPFIEGAAKGAVDAVAAIPNFVVGNQENEGILDKVYKYISTQVQSGMTPEKQQKLAKIFPPEIISTIRSFGDESTPGLIRETLNIAGQAAITGGVLKVGEKVTDKVFLSEAAKSLQESYNARKNTTYSGLDIGGAMGDFGKAAKAGLDAAARAKAEREAQQVRDDIAALEGKQNRSDIEETILNAQRERLNEMSQPFRPTEYVNEMTKKQEAARRGEEPSVIQKGRAALMDLKTKFVDSTAPIQDTLASWLAENKKSETPVEFKPEMDVRNQIDRVLRSPTLASQFMKDHGLVDVIKNVDSLDNLNQYLIAKQAIDLQARGVETGRNVKKDQALVEAFEPQYGEIATQVKDYSNKLLDYAVESGLVAQELAQTLRERYPNYVPMNRIFEEVDAPGSHVASGGVASLSKQNAVKNIEGSLREIENPLTSFVTKTGDIFKEGEKNIAARILAGYEKLPGNPFDLKPLRTREQVEKRISLYEEAADLKPLQDKAARFITTRNKWIRDLQSQINTLEKKGLDTFLKQKTEDSPTLTSGFTTKTTPDRVRFGKGDERDTVVGGSLGSTKITSDIYATTKNKGYNSTKSFVEKLITEPNTTIDKLKQMVGNRDVKSKEIFDEVTKLREQYDTIKEKRKGLFDEAKLLKDVATRGKDTISYLNNGFREIFETTPEIAAAAKSLDVQQMNILSKILALPVRVAKIGITGVNLPFIGANMVRDQVSAFINSSKPLQTSLANPVNFVQSLMAAVGHNKLYDEWVRQGGGGTSFDMVREQAPKTVQQIRADRSIPSKIAYTVTHPGELLRAVEDIISRSEELTRIQQYRGTKKAALKEGMDEKNAMIEGAKASRENTVNFARKGEWGQVLNSAFLYLNPAIQGTRTLLRNLKERPAQTATKIAIASFTPMAIATLWNTSDPQRKKVYDDISPYEKENNLIILPPKLTQDKDGKWNVIKIPLTQEGRSATGLVRKMVESLQGRDPVGMKDVADAFVGTVSPIELTPRSLLSTLTPQIIKPFAEAMTNENFFTGIPIVPESLKGLPAEQQVKGTTSGTARQIGKVLNVSPLQVEAFLKETFGSIAPQVLNAVDTAQASIGTIPEDQIGGKNVVDAIFERFGKARGGEIEQRQIEEVQKILQEQKGASREISLKADKLLPEIRKLPQSEQAKRLTELAKTDRPLALQIKDKLKTSETTYLESTIKQLGVGNGKRAQYIYDHLKTLPEAERGRYLLDLKKKKLLTGQVGAQIRKLDAEILQGKTLTPAAVYGDGMEVAKKNKETFNKLVEAIPSLQEDKSYTEEDIIAKVLASPDGKNLTEGAVKLAIDFADEGRRL